ncbi:hypothetical protein [Phosphitispora sp. TUW77]|uniref:hypothetical protein n=1 Tax=Phosphitispora sp. TUW77 TaxID=3152361 RepID=UPI003AB2A84A
MKVKHLLIAILIVVVTGLAVIVYTRDGGSENTDGPRFLFEINAKDGGTGLKEPVYAATDNQDRILVADSGNHRVAVFTSKGQFLYEIGGTGSSKPLSYPYGIGFLGSRVLVADPGAGSMYEYSGSGDYKKTWITPEQGIRPAQIFVTSHSDVYVTDMAGKQILVFDKDSSLIKTIKSQQVPLGSPHGLAVTGDGFIWVADGGNYNVKLLSPTGETKKVFDGGPVQALSMAKGLAVDSKDRIYVADTLSNLIRVFDEDGNIITAFGTASDKKASFSLPVGIFIDNNDRIYIADQGNNRIQVWSY